MYLDIPMNNRQPKGWHIYRIGNLVGVMFTQRDYNTQRWPTLPWVPSLFKMVFLLAWICPGPLLHNCSESYFFLLLLFLTFCIVFLSLSCFLSRGVGFLREPAGAFCSSPALEQNNDWLLPTHLISSFALRWPSVEYHQMFCCLFCVCLVPRAVLPSWSGSPSCLICFYLHVHQDK